MPEGNLHGHMTGLGTLGGHMQGSGTTDYNELNNKPKINNVTLVGNKTSNDLNLQDKINFNGDGSTYLDGEGNFTVPAGSGGSYSGLTDKPSINSVELDGNLSLSDLDIQEEIDFPGDASRFLNGEGNFTPISVNYNDTSNRPEINSHILTGNQTSDQLGLQDKLPFDSDPNKFLNGAGSFTEVTADYSNLSNKPSIGGVELDGDKSAAQLGLQEVINFPNDPDKYLDGQGIFKVPSYNDITDHPEINGVELTGNKSGYDLELTSGAIASGSGTSVQFTAEGEYNLLKCEVEFEPVQDLHGYDKPWAEGDGLNLIPLTLAKLKAANTSGTWTDNVYTNNNITYEISIDNDGNVQNITVNGTAINNSILFLYAVNEVTLQANTTYYLNGTPTGGGSNKYRMYFENTASYDSGEGTSYTPAATYTDRVRLVVYSGFNAQNLVFRPMMTTGQQETFEPYSNICHISGHSDITINVSPSDDPSEGTDYTTAFDNTYYGGAFDFITGTIKNDYAYIASYAGEVLPGEWLSSLDEYIEGNNPTTGAEVVYLLSEPNYHYVNKTVIDSIIGENYVNASGMTVNVDAASEIYDPVLEYLVNHR